MKVPSLPFSAKVPPPVCLLAEVFLYLKNIFIVCYFKKIKKWNHVIHITLPLPFFICQCIVGICQCHGIQSNCVLFNR